MAGFRDQIESAKQMYDSGTRQQMAIQELIEHYIILSHNQFDRGYLRLHRE